MFIHPLENISTVKAELDHPERLGQQTGTMHTKNSNKSAWMKSALGIRKGNETRMEEI